MLTAMGIFNEKLVNCGGDARGRRAAAEFEGARVKFRIKAHCHRRPFAESKELIAGFWI